MLFFFFLDVWVGMAQFLILLVPAFTTLSRTSELHITGVISSLLVSMKESSFLSSFFEKKGKIKKFEISSDIY